MRRNRVLILFAVVFAVSTAVFWLGTVLAAATITNNGLTLNEGTNKIIDSSSLQADDPDLTGEVFTYTLVTTPTNGVLVLTDTTLLPGAQFFQSDIDGNFLSYDQIVETTDTDDSFDFTIISGTEEITNSTFLITINQPPTISDDLFTIAENISIGTFVDTVITSDANTSETFTYTIETSEPSAAFAIGIDSGDITTNSLLDFEALGTTPHFTLTVQIEDSGMLTDTAVINIDIIDVNEAPTVDPDTFTVAENSSNGTPVGTVTSSDPEDDSLIYDIVGGDPDNIFNIGSTSGQITVADNSFLDFEAQGATPHFSLTVEVSDNEFTDTATVEINLTDVNEAPTVDPDTFTVPENSSNGTDVGTPTASDPEDDSLTFDIVGGDPDNVFDIGATSGQITVADNSFLDFEAQGATPHFSLTVEVNDGSLTDTATIEINLTDVNEAPTVDPDTFTVPEDSSNGAPVGTVTASDPEDNSLAFDIVGGDPDNVFDIGATSGQITVADNSFLDFEAQGATPHFSLTVEVGDGSLTDTATIEINVTDVNEPPTVNDNSFSIDENSSNTAVVGTVTASDPDADDEDALTFGILTGNTGGAFSIANDGSNNGRITVANSSQLDYETRQSFMLGIIVTDTGGLNNTANVTININNLFDEAPTVNNATFTVSEDSNNGVVVGTVTATDPEFASGDELTFSIIGGNTGTVFAINSSSGQITVPDASKLDADAMPTFNLTVQATDRGGKIDTGTITINVSPLPITFIYLPVMLNNYPPVEPNNNCAQSYGIGPATDYEFTADDVEDWYTITLTSSANLSIILSSFEPAQGQLIVYGGSCGNLTLLGNNGNPNTTEKTLHLGIRPAGTYYIRVYSEPVTNTNYTLRVNIN
ncbi:MAG: hypothetical protein CL608_13555 [Anaerolineaceae bacterium]|nr:hypothetical protein [Anaerolineaceae bacterium]